MKTLFFSAIEISNHDPDPNESHSQDSNDTSKEITFNTPDIMSPHDVLSAIKVSVSAFQTLQ